MANARNSRRPIVVTQRGKASAVLLDIDEYQKQLDRMETLEMIAAGEASVRRGEVQSHDEVMQEMDSPLLIDLPIGFRWCYNENMRIKNAIIGLVLGVFCSFSVGSRSASAPVQLFGKTLPDTVKIKKEVPEELVRRRLSSVDLQSLRASPKRLSVAFFDGTAKTFSRSNVFRRGDKNMTWIGRADEDIKERLVLTIHDGVLVGYARTGGKFFRISSAGEGGIAVIDEFPLASKDDDACGTAGSVEFIGVKSIKEGPIFSPRSFTIDVMVAYTEDVRAAAGSASAVEAEAQLAVDDTNDVADNSDVRHKLRLVHAFKVEADEDDFDTMSDARLYLKDGMEDSSHPISTAREDYKADIVSFWVKNGHGYCGQARGIGVDESHAGFSFDRDCYDSLSFAHETGHLMGALHDAYSDPTTSPYAYGHGYIIMFSDTVWYRTVMAYSTYCTDNGETCPRLGLFSNPDKSFFGIAFGSEDESDVARVWNERGKTVSLFR